MRAIRLIARSSRSRGRLLLSLFLVVATAVLLLARNRRRRLNAKHAINRPADAVLRAASVSRVFRTATGDVHACTEISLEVGAGELLVVRGPSGAGKTTLLRLLGGLDTPTSGTVWVGGVNLTTMSDAERARMRRERLGYVLQSSGLIPVLSAAENVAVPLRIQGMAPSARDARVAEVLDLVGLGEYAAQRPYQLSSGQQRRVGIARALVAGPQILLADEPTSQLDSKTAATVMELISELVRTQGVAAVVVTHDQVLIDRADRVLDLRDGRLVP